MTAISLSFLCECAVPSQGGVCFFCPWIWTGACDLLGPTERGRSDILILSCPYVKRTRSFLHFLEASCYIRSPIAAGCWWFMPIILVTQEAEIRRILVWSQPWENSLQDSILKTHITKKGWLNGSMCWPCFKTSVNKKKKKKKFNCSETSTQGGSSSWPCGEVTGRPPRHHSGEWVF
jgi:hypothetical protein